MKEVVNNININGKDYEIGLIVKSFENSHKINWDINVYQAKASLSGDKNSMVPIKLCIEATRQIGFDTYEVEGISFCFKSQYPYYTSYKTVLNKLESTMIFFDEKQIIRRNLISCDDPSYKKQDCVIPVFDTGKILDFINLNKKEDISSITEYIGKFVKRNITNSMLIENMKICVPHNDVMKGFTGMLRCASINKYMVYSFICRNIVDKRDKHKDLNWFMYKMLLVSKII